MREQRYVASCALVVNIDGGAFLFSNFIRKKKFKGDLNCLRILDATREAKSIEELAGFFDGVDLDSLRNTVDLLVKSGALVAEGSNDHLFETNTLAAWGWDIDSAFFHFNNKNNLFSTTQRADEELTQKDSVDPSPELATKHDTTAKDTIPFHASLSKDDLLGIMHSRRTVRSFKARPIPRSTMTNLLYAGLGITGHRKMPYGEQPLGMTPSGGARNPYEGYLVNLIPGEIDRGIYHYSGVTKSLKRLDRPVPEHISPAIGDQEWTNGASSIIFLVADFARSMWKYPTSNALKVVLIEAGHIAQNMMLIAARDNLSLCPSAAISDSVAEELLGVSGATKSVVYSLSLGAPDLTFIQETHRIGSQ